ncbi:cytochrome P450 [Mycobacterium sp.]|uniref:cytochrome P450 n=1 Tax=Mycobacterium sp. TaxID=1785 RepID=UPI001226CBC6|nr:cytochrome P450 [Mycobacterium sp.]TAM69783.1 MAG: cytochrome P450 [Mycobacterium sp.]
MTFDVLSPEVYAKGDPAQNGLPLDAMDRMREQAPCYRHRLDDPMMVDEIWVLTREEDIQQVSRDPAAFSSRRGLTARLWTPFEVELGGKPAMIGLDGEDHVRNRRVVSKAFTPNVVKRFEAEFRVMCRRIVQKALAKGTFNFVEEIAVEMPLNAICELMGVPEKDRRTFLSWVNAYAVPTDPDYAPSPEAALGAVAGIWQYALELAEHRRTQPGEDLMSKIVQARDEDTLDDEELQGFVLLLAGGGGDTTRNAFSHGLHALIRKPEQMAWLRERADDIPASAIQEIVRWATPVIHIGRTATTDTEIAGQPITAGDRVAMLLPGANFDPAVIDDPRTFDLSRDPNRHLSFGMGPHACIGRHIAALEIKLLFEELLRETSTIEMIGEIGYVRDNFLRGVHSLPVKIS